MAARKRRETESFKNYRKHLSEEAVADKQLYRGKVFWNSEVRGTYRRGMMK